MSTVCHYPSSAVLAIVLCIGCGAGHVGDAPGANGGGGGNNGGGGYNSGGATSDSGVGGGDALGDIGTSCSGSALSQLFEQRIRPLVQQGAPTTCNKCHLAGVDLGLFVQPTACASMACMVQKGLVDLSDPEGSRVLQFISQGKPQSALITNAVRQKEYQGFLDWIRYSASCHAVTCGEIADPCGGTTTSAPPSDPTPMLGGCSEAALLQAFQQQVNRWRGRCASCHAPNGAGKTKGPLFLPSSADNALTAMYNLIGLGALDPKSPAQSRMITKPLDESIGGIEHGGGPKIKSKGEQTYIDFVAWATRYANCFAQKP